MRDWLWAVAIGGLAAASPHTSAQRLVPSVVGGMVVGAGVLAVRRGAFARWLPPLDVPDGGARRNRWPGLPGTLCVITSLLLCAPAIGWLWDQYTQSIWRNGHGLFLPLLVLSMARSSLRGRDLPIRSSPWLAAPFLISSVLLAWLGATTRLGYPGALGTILMVPALCLLVLGRDVTRRMAFPLFLLAFLLPIPDGLLDPLWLTSASASLADPLIDRLLDVGGARDQTSFLLAGQGLVVSANCSGASAFYAALPLALAAGWRLGPAARIGLVLLAWPVTVVLNALRVVIIVTGAATWGIEWVHTAVHGISGILTFWAVMATLMITAYAAGARLPTRVTA